MRPLLKPRFVNRRGTKEDYANLIPENSTRDVDTILNPIYTNEKYLTLLAEVHLRITNDEAFNGAYLNERMAEEAYEESNTYLTDFARRKLREVMEDPNKPFDPINEGEENSLMTAINYEVLGYGPLEDLLRDKAVSDILVNTYKHIYTDRSGILRLEPTRFKDNDHLMRVVRKIVDDVGRIIDISTPMVDARLERKSRSPERSVRARVNAIIAPLAVDGAMLSLRKFPEQDIRLGALIANQTLTYEMGELLKGICRAKLNVLIAGGTSSGKTTLLNVLSEFIPPEERIVTIEDTAELHLVPPHVVRLETRPPDPNMVGDTKGEITQRDLVKNSLRMRPDRIIVGEVRGPEALDMLQALNTGHKGSLTTIHANSGRDALTRLESMVAIGGGNIPAYTIRQSISRAFDVILYMQRIGNSRKLTSILEITDMDEDVILLQEIFSFNQTGLDGQSVKGTFQATGIRPNFLHQFAASDIEVPPNSTFSPDKVVEV